MATKTSARGRIVALGLVAAALIASTPGKAQAGPATRNTYLEKVINELVGELREEEPIPGLTVAVSKQGRLLLSKGYGKAKVDSDANPMRPWTRANIGSVTKAAVTGPAAYQLMQAKGIDPVTRTLYGPNGLFEGDFDDVIEDRIAELPGPAANWRAWYRAITVQHLLDHTAGFKKEASKANAADWAGTTEEELTQTDYHRYFLRKSTLLSQPGEVDSYSNHGFGVLTLVIERVAGKPYADYVRDDYLAPMGLETGIQGSRPDIDSCDSHNHDPDAAGQPKVLAFNTSRLGLAAGGFRSSAQDLLQVTGNLAQRYTVDQIDQMGWGANSSGRLTHGGRVAGGTAYVAMYPEGYQASGQDLSGVHVAVAANIWMTGGSGRLFDLVRAAAMAVPANELPADFDRWPAAVAAATCEYPRWGVPLDEYQSVIDNAVARGYAPEWVDISNVGASPVANAVFRSPEPNGAWGSRHGMTSADYQDRYEDYEKAGFEGFQVDSYIDGGQVRYAAIWRKGVSATAAYHGLTTAQHEEKLDVLVADGWQPLGISVASVNGARSYMALLTKEDIGSFAARSRLTADQYQEEYDENKAAGRRLRYLTTYPQNGEVQFSAVWSAKPERVSTRAVHDRTESNLGAHWLKNAGSGYRTRSITAYEHDGQIRFAAFWDK